MALQKVYEKSKAVIAPSYGCPGCYAGIWNYQILDVFDELGIPHDDLILCMGVGCSGMAGAGEHNINQIHCPHGRASAVATGVMLNNPGKVCYVMQGDGDLAGIGLSETMNCANRGVKHVTVFHSNNQVYGTTGGQMAPTTLVGQKTTTSPYGRDAEICGYPFHMAEIIASLEAPKYVARVTYTDTKNLMFAKKCIKKALQVNLAGGYSFVELLSTCPTNWHMSVEQSIEHVKNVTSKEFPIGEFKTY